VGRGLCSASNVLVAVALLVWRKLPVMRS